QDLPPLDHLLDFVVAAYRPAAVLRLIERIFSADSVNLAFFLGSVAVLGFGVRNALRDHVPVGLFGLGGRVFLRPRASAGTGTPPLLAVARMGVLLFGVLVRGFRLLGLRPKERLPVGYWDLVIVRMDFAEGEKTMTVAAIFDKSRLQGRFNARDPG